jgi:DNA helicase-2/ATP-dependent DNA helicase PcrA
MFSEVAPTSPLLQNLNPEQLAAVTLPPTHALILAGAGSGKTRVLTTRIAWLLQTGQVSPGGILAVTFTNKAAKEMMARLSAMLPVNVRGMWIGTFHGLCNRFLRAHYKLANLPQSFQILDTQDQLSAIKRLCKQHNVDDERFPPKQLMWFIAGNKEDGLRAKDVQVRDEEGRKKVEIYALYEEQCQREGVVDFGELMLRSYELLRDNAPVREHYQRRFPPHPDRRVPGHQQAAVRLDQDAGGAGRRRHPGRQRHAGRLGDRGGRRRPEHLRLSRRACGQYGRLRARVRGAAPDQAGAQLPQLRQHPGFGQRADQPQQQAPGQKPAHRGRPRRAGARLRVAHDFAEAQWFVDEVKQLVRDGVERKEIACSTAAMRKAG